ncbi:hypothetical protein CL617_05265, partial [archaeon]|nr:hypothetical protein [archaeon]
TDSSFKRIFETLEKKNFVDGVFFLLDNLIENGRGPYDDDEITIVYKQDFDRAVTFSNNNVDIERLKNYVKINNSRETSEEIAEYFDDNSEFISFQDIDRKTIISEIKRKEAELIEKKNQDPDKYSVGSIEGSRLVAEIYKLKGLIYLEDFNIDESEKRNTKILFDLSGTRSEDFEKSIGRDAFSNYANGLFEQDVSISISNGVTLINVNSAVSLGVLYSLRPGATSISQNLRAIVKDSSVENLRIFISPESVELITFNIDFIKDILGDIDTEFYVSEKVNQADLQRLRDGGLTVKIVSEEQEF